MEAHRETLFFDFFTQIGRTPRMHPAEPESLEALRAIMDAFDSPITMDEMAKHYGVTMTGCREFAASRMTGLQQ